MRIKRWLWALAIIAVVLLSSKIYLLDSAASPGTAFVIDTDAWHRLATASGPLPDHIEVEKIGTFAFPKKLVVAGESFHLHPMVLLSHRIVWSDRSIIIDTGVSPAAGKKMPGAKLDESAYNRMQAAMRNADLILFTHEHSDHMGGLASSPDFASIAKHARVTREQLNGPKLERSDFAPGALEQLQPFDYQGMVAVAPGVVVQKAPGHTTGTQLIYVELKNGQRYLFVGDIAWTFENITRERGRPRLAELLMKEDRAQVAAQLQALHKLPKEIHIIVAHDPLALEHDVNEGYVKQGFTS